MVHPHSTSDFEGKTKRKFLLHDLLEIVRRFVRFFIIKIVAATDAAMAATIAPTKMPARALVFKPDDTVVGNSARKRNRENKLSWTGSIF